MQRTKMRKFVPKKKRRAYGLQEQAQRFTLISKWEIRYRRITTY